MKKLFLTLTVAFATLYGFAQESTLDKDSVTICFKLASKTAGEKATLIYSDYTACDVVALHPVTDSEGKGVSSCLPTVQYIYSCGMTIK